MAVAFSADGKYLITQTGAPDWTLSLWAWEKPKLLASVKVVNPVTDKNTNPYAPSNQSNNNLVYAVSINPLDNGQVAILGSAFIKILRFQEGAFKAVPVQKIDTKNFLSHCWTNDDRLVVGTEEGKILVFENTGELKCEITYVNNVTQNTRAIHSLGSFSKGFMIGCAGGAVAIYERNEESITSGAQALAAQSTANQTKELYRKSKEFNLHDSSAKVLCLALSPSEDSIVCSLDNCQLYSMQLSATEMKGDEAKLEVFSQAFHHGIITGMDTCIRKPLIVTCSSDHSIRVWNYLDNTSELIKYFPEEAFSVAIHPSGLYILVGFSDKLRLMNLLIDDIRPYREFTIRGCREVGFILIKINLPL